MLENQAELLMTNPATGATQTFEAPELPAGEVSGSGFHAAPRRLRSHRVVIDKGEIENPHVVVPTPWNAAPRSEDDPLDPYESSPRAPTREP